MAIVMFITGFLTGMSFIILFERYYAKAPTPPSYGLPFNAPKGKKASEKKAPKVNDDKKAWLKERERLS